MAAGIVSPRSTSVSAVELVGVWRLVSCLDLTETGDTTEGPLGTAPRGLLIYHPHGYMSVSMMRSDELNRSDPDTIQTAPAMSFMGYSGSWRLVEGPAVVHRVEVSAHPHMVGTEQTREVVLEADQLFLYGTAVISARPLRRRLHWQRCVNGI